MRNCRFCTEPFTPLPGKPGHIDVCYATECQRHDAKQTPEPDKLGGNMVWDHKTAPELEIKPLARAQAFAKLTRRTGCGPLRAITQSKAPARSPAHEASKAGSGTENRAQYYSRLGEKRTVKL